MKIKKYTEANRQAWNEAMPKHQDVAKKIWDEKFKSKFYHVQIDPELSLLNKIGIKNKSIAHLCCNNGVELLSLKNLGAGFCVGFDICDEAITEAAKRAENNNIDCNFFQTDVYEIPEKFNNTFELVYITIGALYWLPDLKLFFKKANKLLKKNGHIFIYEEHPFILTLNDESADDNEIFKIKYPYFKEEPYMDTDGIDYIGKTVYKSKPMYVFTQPLSDIFMGLLENKFKITYFKEYEEDISGALKHLENTELKLPLSYILIGEKE